MYKDIKNILVGNEKVVQECRMHWAVFINSGFIVALAILGGLFHWMMGTLILFMALYPFFNALITYLTLRLVLTNKRVLARFGFFSKDLIQIPLKRIESAHLEETLLGQWLGYSTVVVRGTGTGSIPIPFVKDGNTFQKRLEAITLKDDAEEDQPSSRSPED